MPSASVGSLPPRRADAPRSAYVHVPFCARRCGYCNFSVVAGRDELVPRYLAALERELAGLQQPRGVATLYLGGGTPTRLSLGELERLLELVQAWFRPLPQAEVTVEANPADVTRDLAALLARYGVNRVSLGAQSLDAAKLRALERDHTPDDVRRAVDLLRARVPAVSLDLIFAAPGEHLGCWAEDVRAALRLAPDHLSTYGLTIERGTTYYGRWRRGQLARPDEETEAAMYELAIDAISAAGYEHYEVSNFARPGCRSRHNEAYWTGREYFAAGPGAARYVDGCREVNHGSTFTWMARLFAGESPVALREQLPPEDRAREALVLGLRRLEGIDRRCFIQQTGFDLDALGGAALRRHVQWGLLLDEGWRIRLSRRGLLVSDSLWADYLRV
jgi:oxygen-independent coproporphyrinogen-3 oxidase